MCKVKSIKQLVGAVSAILLAFAFASIPMGCTAEDGLPGVDGTAGAVGPTGSEGTAKCAACHNDSSVILAKGLQYRNSVHYTGGNFSRSSAACARCHTNEGFIQYVKTSIDTFAGGVTNPTPQNCRTCHSIHTKYDSTDFNLRVTGNVTIRASGETFDFGNAAVCATCHQPRTTTPLPAVSNTDSVTMTTSWGPHHGVEAGILKGAVGYELNATAGAVPYTNSEHSTAAANACVDCHMAKPSGASAGGHSLHLSYGTTGTTPLLNGCNVCHDPAAPTLTRLTNFNYRGVKDSVTAMLDTLKALLVSKNVMDTAGKAKAGKRTANYAGAFWNYTLIVEDGSSGNHNYPYIRALLKNSIAALKQ